MMELLPHCDAVIPFDGRIADLVRAIQPDILFKGEEYRDRYIGGERYAKGVQLIPRRIDISTTQILEFYARQE